MVCFSLQVFEVNRLCADRCLQHKNSGVVGTRAPHGVRTSLDTFLRKSPVFYASVLRRKRRRRWHKFRRSSGWHLLLLFVSEIKPFGRSKSQGTAVGGKARLLWKIAGNIIPAAVFACMFFRVAVSAGSWCDPKCPQLFIFSQ